MFRLVIALTGVALLTLAPVGYKFALHSREPADFTALTAKLAQISLNPDGWTQTEDIYEFDDHWRSRLGLHHHRSAQLLSPDGRRLTVLLMLSETGEQLFHTPDICYAAIGCEIEGDVASVPLSEPAKGDVRVVSVTFKQVGSSQTNTVAFGYWVGSEWVSPAPSNILNTLGREPFLLKIQVLFENAKPDEAETQQMLHAYFGFLGEQLQQQTI